MDTCRHSTNLRSGWENSDVTVLVDGAKRDHSIRLGDMGISVPSVFVSTRDMESVKNALQTIYDNQVNDAVFVCLQVGVARDVCVILCPC